MLESGSVEEVVRVHDLYADHDHSDYIKGMAEDGVATTDLLSRCIGVGVYSEETGNAYIAHFMVESMTNKEYLDGLADFYADVAEEENFYPSELSGSNFRAFAGGNVLPDVGVFDMLKEMGGKRR